MLPGSIPRFESGGQPWRGEVEEGTQLKRNASLAGMDQ